MSKLIHIDKDYKQWIQDLKSRYRRSQIKAAVKINNEVLAYYWDLGRDIVARNAENKYGTGFYANLSQDLRDAIPNTEGLSESSIRYAKRFYELYFQIIKNLPQVVEILEDGNLPQIEAELEPTAPSHMALRVLDIRLLVSELLDTLISYPQ